MCIRDSLYPPKVRRWLPAVALALAILYGLAVGGHWVIRPDSGVYMALGRSLADGRGMEYNGKQMWGIPPLVPLLIAGCRWLAGPHAMWLINTAMSLFGIGTALAALGIANRLPTDEGQGTRMRAAVGTFLVVGVSARLFGDSAPVLTDVPFSFLFCLSLYSFIRGIRGHWAWCIAGSLAMVAATYTRLVSLALAPAIVAAMVLHRKPEGYRQRLVATFVGAALVAGAFLYWWFEVRSWSDPASADYGKAIAGGYLSILSPDRWALMAKEILNTPQAVAGALVDQKLPWVNLVPTALILAGMAVATRRRQWMVVLPVIFYVGFLVAWGGGAMAARYLLPIMPLLAYCLLAGARAAATWAARVARSDAATDRLPRLAVGVIVAACLAISLPKNVRTIYWARHEKFYKHYAHGEWRGLVEASEAIRKRDRPAADDIVATKEGSVVHYLSGLRVVVLPLWKREGPGLGERPPKEFARVAAEGDFRFVIVPMDEPGWGAATLKEVEKTGAFLPPRQYRDMALLQRR